MSNDLMKRAGRALESAASREVQPAGRFDPAKGRALLARAQAALAQPAKPQNASPPPPKPEPQTVIASPPPPSVERVKLPMMCSARGASYVVIAERRGNELRFIGHEMPAPGPGGTPPASSSPGPARIRSARPRPGRPVDRASQARASCRSGLMAAET
jgi:hypothetical protein